MGTLSERPTSGELAHVKTTAQRDAEAILESSWDSDCYPVDPFAIAASLGVDARVAQIEGDVSGILRKRPNEAPMIVVDLDDPPVRQRFTCAHELGHYVQRKNQGAEDIDAADLSFVDRRGGLATKGTDLREIYANEFAATLLMPAIAVRSLRKMRMTTAELSRFFGVSPLSMEFRLKNLGLA